MASKNDVTVPNIDFQYNAVKDKVGKVVKEARNKKGYTIEKLSEITGVSGATISGIESGKSVNPNSENLVRLALALGFSLDSLFGLQPETETTDQNKLMTKLMLDFVEIVDSGLFPDPVLDYTESPCEYSPDDTLERYCIKFETFGRVDSFGAPVFSLGESKSQYVYFSNAFGFLRDYMTLKETLKGTDIIPKETLVKICMDKHYISNLDESLEPPVPF